MPAALLSSTVLLPTLRARVASTRDLAPGIRQLEFVAMDDALLPEWTPGAHLDVHLPSGSIRQYSLCSDPHDLRSYRIAVLNVPDGRGGSAEVHQGIHAGAELTLGVPRNQFPLRDAAAYVFVAGGIGITPILAMVRAAARLGKPWKLVYGARSDSQFVFLEELTALASASWGIVECVAQDTAGHIDLAGLVAASGGQAVYCCGPGSLMTALGDEMRVAGREQDLTIERFTASPTAEVAAGSAGSFTVELSLSGSSVSVQPGQSILEALRAAGIDAPSSCEMGICGTCETSVLSGEIDHRDALLTDAERASGDTMLICVSRAAGDTIVLDR